MNNTVTRQVLGKVTITSKGEYDSLKSYEILDVVTYQGSSYLSKKYNNNSLPTNGEDWQLLAQKGDTVTYKAGTDIEITEDNTINYVGRGGGTGNVSSDTINSIVVVDSLPTTEVDGVLYLVKESGSSGETPSGTNIFTNYTSFTDYYLNSSGIIKSLTGGYSYYVSCEANTTYTVNGVGNKLRAGAFSSVPISGSTTTNFVTNDGGSTLNITTGADEIYLFVYLGTSDASLTEEQIIAGCTIIKN